MANNAAKKKGPSKAIFIVDGEEYVLPRGKLTLGEQADLEEAVGISIDKIRGEAQMTLGLLYVAMRRKDPSVTIEQVRGLRSEQIEVKERSGPPAKTQRSRA